MKKYKIECKYERLSEGYIELEVEEDELEEWGSIRSLRNNDTFFDMVADDGRSFPSFDEVSIKSLLIEEV